MRAEERGPWVRAGLLRALGVQVCWCTCWLKGESSGSSLPLRNLVIPKAHPTPSPRTAHVEFAAPSEIGLWVISSECVSVLRCLQQELLL